jgi:hypothetical protein
MNATTIFIAGIGAGVLGRWAHNQPAVPSAGKTVSVVASLILISAIDHGQTQQVARGFAWLFLAAVLLSSDSILTGLANSGGATAQVAGNTIGNLGSTVKGK